MTEADRADLDRLGTLLEALEQRLRWHKPDIRLPPGLLPDQAREMADAYGLRLTDELVTFYAWHDGIGTTTTSIDSQPVSLAHGLEMTACKRREAREVHRDWGLEPEQIFRDDWFTPGSRVLIGGGPTLDLSVEPDRETPVLSIFSQDAGTPDYPRVSFPSWGHVVAIWTELFDVGAYGWHPETGLPRHDLLEAAVAGNILESGLF